MRTYLAVCLGVLTALPLQAALRARVHTLASAGAHVRYVERRVYLKLDPGEETYKLYVRDLDGAAIRGNIARAWTGTRSTVAVASSQDDSPLAGS